MDLCACGSLLFEIMLTFNDFLSMLLHPPLSHPEADESASCSSKVMRCRWSRWAPHRKSFLLVDGWSWISILNSSSLTIKKESPFCLYPYFGESLIANIGITSIIIRLEDSNIIGWWYVFISNSAPTDFRDATQRIKKYVGQRLVALNRLPFIFDSATISAGILQKVLKGRIQTVLVIGRTWYY